ncbi:MAG: amino acid permease [Candidatus Eremiobacteraeota bacterium]|nr:amino acid permease [Candidatus Eremiobacteraeota bacterium]
MIGVGPFLTLPAMLTAMGGPHILYAWLAGAVLALCDGLVYAQLAAALPGSGGSYVYLREAYRPFGLGRLMAFLYIFQVMLVAPLSISAGGVGFASYLGFFVALTPWQKSLAASALCAFMTWLLYRPTATLSKMSVAMLAVVILTVTWVIGAGLLHFSWSQAFDFPEDPQLLKHVGAVSLLAMYNYGGYNNVCNLGDEIRTPWKTMPRAIVGSIVLVVALYLTLSTVILGTVPWQKAAASPTIASDFIGQINGPVAAQVMTGLILFVTAASLFSVILGYSRVPYAAALDGQFFPIFARVHPKGHFPHVSLLTLGGLALPFCFLSLDRLISWLILVQILSQFIWQCAGVILLRRYRKDLEQPFTMWLYPLPALLSLGLWLYVFVSAAWDGQLFALGFLAVGLVAYRGLDARSQ